MVVQGEFIELTWQLGPSPFSSSQSPPSSSSPPSSLPDQPSSVLHLVRNFSRHTSKGDQQIRAFLRWAQTHTTFCLHLQHGFECCHQWHWYSWWWSSGASARYRSDDSNTGKQYCRCHRPSLTSPFFIVLMLPYMVP